MDQKETEVTPLSQAQVAIYNDAGEGIASLSLEKSPIQPKPMQFRSKYDYYCAFLRWLNQDTFLLQTLLLRPPPPFIVEQPQTLVDSPNRRLKWAYAKHNLLMGAQFFTNKLWPSAFSALLLHDIIAYIAYPEARYGNTLAKILLGISPNQLGLSSHLGRTLVKTYSYWLAPSLLFFAPFATSLARALSYYPWRKPLPNLALAELETVINVPPLVRVANLLTVLPANRLSRELAQAQFSILYSNELSYEQRASLLQKIEYLATQHSYLLQWQAIKSLSQIVDGLRYIAKQAMPASIDNLAAEQSLIKHNALQTLRKLSQYQRPEQTGFTIKPLPRYFYTNYQLWSIGEPQSIWLQPLFFSMPLFILYAQIRLGELWLQKLIGAFEFVAAKRYCERDKKVWQYMSALADYACSVCGDWPFVNEADSITSQGCVDGLLLQARTPQLLQQSFKRLASHPSFHTLNLSQQNWTTWSLTEWDLMLTEIEKITALHLQSFNLSRLALNPVAPDTAKIIRLASFLQRVAVVQMDLSQQNLGPEAIQALLPGLANNVTTYLNLSGNKVADEGFIALGEFAEYTALATLKADANSITSFGFNQFTAVAKNSSLTALSLSHNQIDEQGVTALNSVFSEQLAVLDLSSNNLVAMDYSGTQDKSFLPALRVLRLANTNMDDTQLAELAAHLSYWPLTQLDISNNRLSGMGLQALFEGLANSTVTQLALKAIKIDQAGLKVITEQSSPIIGLDLANNPWTRAECCDFMSSLPPITHLDMSNTGADDACLHVLSETLDKGEHPLRRLTATHNLITALGANKLFNQLNVTRLTHLNLSQNLLNDTIASALRDNLASSALQSLQLSGNQLQLASGQAIADNLPKKLKVLELNDNPLGDGTVKALSAHLLSPLPQFNKLSKRSISQDQQRALSHAKPVTHLQQLGLRNAGLSDSSAQLFCRIASPAKLQVELSANPIYHMDITTCRPLPSKALLNPIPNDWRQRQISITREPQSDRASHLFYGLLPVVGSLVLLYLVYHLLSFALQRFTASEKTQRLRFFSSFKPARYLAKSEAESTQTLVQKQI